MAKLNPALIYGIVVLMRVHVAHTLRRLNTMSDGMFIIMALLAMVLVLLIGSEILFNL